MKSRAPRRLAAVVIAGCAMSLTGCGSDSLSPDLHPGAAAVAGDYKVTMEELDELSEDLCGLIEPQLEATGDALPMSRLRAMSLSNLLVDGELTRRFAEEENVDANEQLLAEQADLFEQLRQQGFSERELEVALEFSERGTFHQFVVTEVAKRELGESVTNSTLLQRGEEIFAEWLETQDYEVDPRIGSLDPLEGGVFQPGDAGLSVAVSEQARQGVAREDAELHQDYLEDLPASQRCGEVSEEETVAPNPLAP